MNFANKLWLGSLMSLCFAVPHLSAVQMDPEIIKMIQESSNKVVFEKTPSEEEIERDRVEAQIEESADLFAESEQPVKDIDASQEGEEVIINGYDIALLAYYSSSHHAAFHSPINKAANGRSLEIEDNSIWEIHPWDAYKVMSWQRHHTIVLAPNKNIFTCWSYPYKFINLDSKDLDIIKVNLSITPVFKDSNIDIYVHWIDEIDYNNRIIRLEDGSIWQISWLDRNVIRNFQKYNIVILGTNDGWFRSSNPNILICVKNNQYIRGNVIGK
jgi:hypothetical protein